MNLSFIFKFLLACVLAQQTLGVAIIPISARKEVVGQFYETGHNQAAALYHDDDDGDDGDEDGVEELALPELFRVKRLNLHLDDLQENIQNLFNSINSMERRVDLDEVPEEVGFFGQHPLAAALDGQEPLRHNVLDEFPGLAINGGQRSELIFPDDYYDNADSDAFGGGSLIGGDSSSDLDALYKKVAHQVILSQLIRKLEKSSKAVKGLNAKLETTLGSIQINQADLVKQLNSFLEASERVHQALTQ